jgi:FtsH-binding integral membrane protein
MNQFDDKLDNNVFGSGHETMEHELLQSARTNFVKKVYSILGIQLLVTSGFVSLSTFNDAFRLYQQENLALFWVSFFVCLVSMIALFCVRGLATRSPINIILLSLFTLCESYSVSMICGFYEPVSVLNAAIATLAATIALTLYAIKTESDFS